MLLKVALNTIDQPTNQLHCIRQAGGFLRFPPPIKLTATIDITEILLKVILSTITHHRYTYTGGCSGSRVASYWMVKRRVRMYTRGDS
jgi:hypothetical protein